MSLLPEVLLDACSLINFMASGVDLNAIAAANNCQFVATSIAMNETLYIAGEPPEGERELIDTAALVRSGALGVVELDSTDLNEYVNLARIVDDGEASTLAVAKHRGLSIATDDRRAIRLAIELEINVHTTAQALRRWASATSASEDAVANALRSVEGRGNFVPRRHDPDRPWWDASVHRS